MKNLFALFALMLSVTALAQYVTQEPFTERIVAWDFTGALGNATSESADFINTKLDVANPISRGTNAAGASQANSFATTGFGNDAYTVGLSQDFFEWSLSAAAGNTIDLTSVIIKVKGANGYTATPGVECRLFYSTNGGTTFQAAGTQTKIGNGLVDTFDLSGIGDLQELGAGTTIHFRFNAEGQSGNGVYGFHSASAGDYGLEVRGVINPTCYTYVAHDTTVCNTYTAPGTGTTYPPAGQMPPFMLIQDTLFDENGANCHEIVQESITFKYDDSTAMRSVTNCNSFELPSGTVVTTTDIYWDVDPLPAVNGCDSVVRWDVTINTENKPSSFKVVACGSFTSLSGTTYTESGVYIDTAVGKASNTCDSIMTIDLTIIDEITSTIDVEVCYSYTVPSGDEVYTSSGSYSDTLESSRGCDSVITINLTVNPRTFTFIDTNVCNLFTVPSGDESYTESGIYNDTLLGVAGCDSVLVFNLTMQEDVTFQAVVSCDSFVVASGATYYSTGIYVDTVPNEHNCDSIINYDLTIVNSTSHTMNVKGCTGTGWTAPSGAVYTTDGTYIDIIENTVGCDSVITINLTFGAEASNEITVNACEEYTAPSGFPTYFDSGTYMDTIPGTCGDSVLTINLFIRNKTIRNLSVTSCNSYTVPSGDETHTSSGIYKDTLPSQYGCDSILNINLTIITKLFSSVDTSACDSIILPSKTFGTLKFFSSDQHNDTVVSSGGCDSIITYDFTINNTQNGIFDIEACNFYTSPSGKYTIFETDTIIDTIQTVLGCDSIIELNVDIKYNKEKKLDHVVSCDQYTLGSGKIVYFTGVFRDTILGATTDGCDSIYIHEVEIIHSTAGSFDTTVCESYTVPSGDETYTVSGTYLDTITNAVGCDSVLTITLTVNYNQTSTQDVEACYTYTVPSGDETYTASGTYMDTIPTSLGCDSIMTINLTILDTTYSTIDTLVCSSYTVPSGDETYTNSGQYFDTIPNFKGCDSLITINLTVAERSFGTIDTTVCETYTVPSGDETYTVSGTYEDTITNFTGCADSIITINLTVNYNTFETIDTTVCDTYTVPSGDETYTVSGTYMDTIPNAIGCDSIFTINLTVKYSTTSTINVEQCVTYTVPSGDETYTMSGTYEDTIPNAVGCDSVITINLTILEPTTSTISPVVCYTYTVPSGDETYTMSGTYSDTIPNADGCDSVITINLTVNDETTSTINPVVCDTYTSPSGMTYTNSGTYMDTIANANGCDSVITINLTVNYSTTATINPSACVSYTVPSGDETYTTSGTYMDTITNTAGCDSVLTINLTILDNTSSSITVSECVEYTVPSGDETYTTSGTYMDTIPNADGCDSIITIDLTILSPTASNITEVHCYQYTVPSGDETYTTSGIYTDTLVNANGCDSVITIDLTINGTTTSTITEVHCYTYTVPSGDETYTVSGTYMDTIPNVNGCDSVITIDLTINQVATATISPTACLTYTVPSGDETYTVSGTYEDTIPSAAGCDSIITINLTVISAATSTINVAQCYQYTVPSGDETYTMSGTYEDTLTSVTGCDSIITINLTINNDVTSAFTVDVCETYTVPSGDETYTMSGTYMDTIPSAAGCDSIMTITVNILQATFHTVLVDGCDSVTVNGTTYDFPGEYTQTFTNSAGCDSIVTIVADIRYTPEVPSAFFDTLVCVGEDLPELFVKADQREDLLISGVFDGPLMGGQPKVVELYATQDIPNLAIYSLGSANNGGGTDGIEFDLPNMALTAGQSVTITSSAYYFEEFFGVLPIIVDSTSSGAAALEINGNDAVELFKNGIVVDVFGQTNVNGSGKAWDYVDGWAYRKSYKFANGGTFDASNWTFSGPNALDNEIDNASAATPFPLADFDNVVVSNFNWYDDAALTNEVSTTDKYQVEDGSVGIKYYYVTNTNVDCVSEPDSVEVEIVEGPSLDVLVNNATTVPGNGSIDVTVIGGTAPYTYKWTHGPTTEDLDNLDDGFYTIKVTDSNSCKVDTTVFLSNEAGIGEINEATFTVYPNPSATGIFTIEQQEFVGGHLWVTDMSGRTVYEANLQNQETTIDLSALAKGSYQLFIQKGNRFGQRMLIK